MSAPAEALISTASSLSNRISHFLKPTDETTVPVRPFFFVSWTRTPTAIRVGNGGSGIDSDDLWLVARRTYLVEHSSTELICLSDRVRLGRAQCRTSIVIVAMGDHQTRKQQQAALYSCAAMCSSKSHAMTAIKRTPFCFIDHVLFRSSHLVIEIQEIQILRVEDARGSA